MLLVSNCGCQRAFIHLIIGWNECINVKQEKQRMNIHGAVDLCG